MPLTDSACRSFKAAETTQRKPDGGGLSLEITPTGTKRWRFDISQDGKRKTFGLGVYPEVSLKEARDQRDELKKMRAAGVDLSAHRKAKKQADAGVAANCLKIVTEEWLAKKEHEWVESYFVKVEANLINNVLPWLGSKAMEDITAPDILAVLYRIQDRDALETAHRTRAYISQIFKYAICTGRAVRNPAPDLIGALKKPKVRHMAAITEPIRLGALLRMIDTYKGTLTVRCAMKLAPLVYVRPNELRKAKWQDINLDKAEWSFTASKTHQAHIVPLSKQAVDILKTIQPLTGHGIYVFPGPSSDERPMSENAVLCAFRRMGIEKDEMTGHGFRATARTLLDERLGFEPSLIEHQLAHQVKDPNGRAYNRTSHLYARKMMMQTWADYLDNLKAGKDIDPREDAEVA